MTSNSEPNLAQQIIAQIEPLIREEVAKYLSNLGNFVEITNQAIDQLGQNQVTLQQMVIQREYPNDFAVIAQEAWERFIYQEWLRINKLDDDAEISLSLVKEPDIDPLELDDDEDE